MADVRRSTRSSELAYIPMSSQTSKNHNFSKSATGSDEASSRQPSLLLKAVVRAIPRHLRIKVELTCGSMREPSSIGQLNIS